MHFAWMVIAREMTNNFAVSAKHQGLRNHIVLVAQVCYKQLVCREPDRVRDLIVFDESPDFLRSRAALIVDVKPDDFNSPRPKIVCDPDQLSGLLLAWLAPGRPKIDYQDFASVL